MTADESEKLGKTLIVTGPDQRGSVRNFFQDTDLEPVTVSDAGEVKQYLERAEPFDLIISTSVNFSGLHLWLEASSKKPLLKPIREFISHELERSDVISDESRVFQYQLAIDEAVTNAMEHGNNFDPERKVSILVESNPVKELTFVVTDEGDGFELDQVGGPKMVSKRGRGIHLIKNIMDEVSVEGSELSMQAKPNREGEEDQKEVPSES